MEPTTWDNVGQHYTADGVLIVPGLRIINYDRRADTVIEPVRYGNPAEPQWFVTEHGIFDGSRMQAAPPTDSGPAHGPSRARSATSRSSAGAGKGTSPAPAVPGTTPAGSVCGTTGPAISRGAMTRWTTSKASSASSWPRRSTCEPAARPPPRTGHAAADRAPAPGGTSGCPPTTWAPLAHHWHTTTSITKPQRFRRKEAESWS